MAPIAKDVVAESLWTISLVHDATTERAVPLNSGVICQIVHGEMTTSYIVVVHTSISFGSCVPTSLGQSGLLANCGLGLKNQYIGDVS